MNNFIAQSIHSYIKDLKQKGPLYCKKEAKAALRRTGVTTSRGTLKKKIVSD